MTDRMGLIVQAAEASDPLVPGPVDVIGLVGLLIAVTAMVVALVAWLRHHRQGRSPLLELLVIVALPVAGPVAYLIARRRAAPEG